MTDSKSCRKAAMAPLGLKKARPIPSAPRHLELIRAAQQALHIANRLGTALRPLTQPSQPPKGVV